MMFITSLSACQTNAESGQMKTPPEYFTTRNTVKEVRETSIEVVSSSTNITSGELGVTTAEYPENIISTEFATDIGETPKTVIETEIEYSDWTTLLGGVRFRAKVIRFINSFLQPVNFILGNTKNSKEVKHFIFKRFVKCYY